MAYITTASRSPRDLQALQVVELKSYSGEDEDEEPAGDSSELEDAEPSDSSKPRSIAMPSSSVAAPALTAAQRDESLMDFGPASTQAPPVGSEHRSVDMSPQEQVNLFHVSTEFSTHYPSTSVLWAPAPLADMHDLLVSTGDYVRLWRITDSGKTQAISTLVPGASKSSGTKECAPVTCSAWNRVDTSLIVTGDVEHSLSIWDVHACKELMHAIAHDREVLDVQWIAGSPHIIVTASSDASLRMFDTRYLRNSLVVHEREDRNALVTVRCNQRDPNYLATMDSRGDRVEIFDIRLAKQPLATLSHPEGIRIHDCDWSPRSASLLVTGNDVGCHIWDVSSAEAAGAPALRSEVKPPVQQVRWAHSNARWIATTNGHNLTLLWV